MSINLSKFCDKERGGICEKPFLFKGFTVATDGHSALFLDSSFVSCATEKDALPVFENKIFENVVSGLSGGTFIDIPELTKPAETECYQCKGSGRVAIMDICPECDGDGDVLFNNDYSSYECECLSCYGLGERISTPKKTEQCDCCKGSGKTISITDSRITIPGINTGFNWKFYERVQDQKNLKIKESEVEAGGAVVFKFDGGFYYVMGMRG